MKRTIIAVLSLAAGLGLLAATALGQIGFKQDERMLVQKYKASTAKFEEGKALFAKGKFGEAEKKLRECLATFEKHADAHWLMAQIELKRGDVDAALVSIESAKTYFVEIGQLYSYTHQEMMNDLRDQRARLEESVRAGEDAVSQLRSQRPGDMTQTEINKQQGAVEQDKNLIAQIDQQLRNPIPQTMTIPASYYYVHGNVLFKLKRYQDAVIQYQETVRLDPGHEFASNNLASILFAAGQYQEALDVLIRAEANGVKINPAFKKDLEDRLAKK